MSRVNINVIFCFICFLFVTSNCFGQKQNDEVKVKKFDAPIETVTWSPDGTFYITTEKNKLLFWDSRTDRIIGSKSDYDASILSVKISDDSSTIVIVYNDNTFAVKGVRNNKYFTHQMGIGDVPIFDAVFVDNYYTLLIPLDGCNIYKFFCLLTTNDSIVKSDVIPVTSYVFGLDIDNRNKKLLVTTSDGRSHIFDTTTRKEIKNVKGYSEVSILSKFDKTGQYFLYASDKYTVNIQAVASIGGTEEYSIVNYDEPVNTADFSPDGNSVAIADKRGFVKIYDMRQGFVKDILKLDNGDIAFSCEFSPDGKSLLVGTSKGKVVRWTPKSQQGMGGMIGGFSGNGSFTGNGNGNGNGNGTGTAKENYSQNNAQNRKSESRDKKQNKEDDKDRPVFVVGNQDDVKGQANIFNTANAKKVVDLTMHNIYVTAGVGTINSDNFLGNIKLKVGYHNFQLYPFYWGGGLGFDVGFTNDNVTYKYKVNGKDVFKPILLGLAPTAKGGFHYLFDKIDLLLFAELGIGANIRALAIKGYMGMPTYSFFMDVGTGLQWKALRAEFDVEIDTNFIYSLNCTVGCSFGLGSGKRAKGGK